MAIAVATIALFQFDFATGLLLGCVLGAESPAVIVPAMLRLKGLGWGVKKGIPDAILTGSALSDVLLLLGFSLLLAVLSQGSATGLTLGGLTLGPVQLLPLHIIAQIVLGVLLGWLTAHLLVSILVTAPLGAWAIPTFAPKLLERGEVDPTKVTVAQQIVLLAAVDTSPLAQKVLTKAAELARRSDSEVIVLHVIRVDDPRAVDHLQMLASQRLADIRYRFVTAPGSVPEAIVDTAQTYGVAEIILGKRGHRPLEEVLVGSVSQAVVETSLLPVVLVEDDAVSRQEP
jgi:nucleotide-binding universal stress UspA family protein